jgi:hypothetical protein
MKIYIFLCLSAFGWQSPQPAVSPNGIPSDAIPWEFHKDPVWSDYTAKPNLSGYPAAMTTWAIYYHSTVIGDSILVQVIPYFLRDSSWVNPKFRTNYLLNHEQRHFDIAEIIARRTRAYFHQWRGSGIDNFHVYENQARGTVWKDDLSVQYDAETAHGTNSVQQQNWNDKIESLVCLPDSLRHEVFKIPLTRTPSPAAAAN